MAVLESVPVETRQDASFRILLSPKRVARALVAIIAILTVLSVAEQYVIHILGREDLEEFLIAVDLDAEANIPTWYSSASLLACAVLLGWVAARTRQQGGGFVGHWRWMSGIFVFLSIDETAQLHEHLGRLHEVWKTHGIFYFAWVIPGAAVVLLFVLAYARFLIHLPASTRRRFLLAGIVYVTGALGVEALSGWRAETMGMNNMTHSLIATVEEVMEMTGVAIFILALLRHLGGEAEVIELDITPRW